MAKFYVDEIGKTIRLDCATDVSGASAVKVKYKKPSGTTGTWVASVVGGDNNQIEYTLVADDLDEAGLWVFQAQIEEAGGVVYYGKSVEVVVYDNFE